MSALVSVIEFLKGKKTYLVAAVWALAVFFNLTGYLSADVLAKIEAFLLPLGLVTLRAGVKKD
jgi:hypothetical protein